MFCLLIGFASCGNWLISNSDPYDNCNCSLFKSDTLRKGCENFYSLKWDNPTVSYVEVNCPPELSSLHCSYPYALEESMPETCERNDFGVVTTSSSTSSTTMATSEYLFVMGFVYVYSKTKKVGSSLTLSMYIFSQLLQPQVQQLLRLLHLRPPVSSCLIHIHILTSSKLVKLIDRF